MSVTFKAFNTMLLEFFNDLSDVLEEYEAITSGKSHVQSLIDDDENTREPLEQFVSNFVDHENLIMNKDDGLFDAATFPFIDTDKFRMVDVWKTLDEDNKVVIWNYIHQLFLTAKTVSSMTPKVLDSIESLAKGFLSRVEDGSLSEEDAKDPMIILQEMMKNEDIMKAFGAPQS